MKEVSFPIVGGRGSGKFTVTLLIAEGEGSLLLHCFKDGEASLMFNCW